MKTKSVFVLAAIVATTSGSLQKANAQQYWSLTGNGGTNPPTHFLGTTDNKALVFKTQSTERMRIGQGGFVGIGTTSPAALLDIAAANSTGSKDILHINHPGLFNSGDETQITFTQATTPVGRISNYYQGNNTAGWGLKFYTYSTTFNTNPAMTIQGNGNVGIGTTTPKANLHIFRGSSGTVTPNANSPLIIENSTNNYISLLTPTSGEKGIIFGDNANPVNGAILYNSSENMLFNTGKHVTKMVLTATGKLGIGNTSPTRELDINHGTSSGASFGLRLRNIGGNNEDWTLYTLNANGDLQLYGNGTLKGSFDDQSGVYSPISDRRLKRDIEDAPDVLEKVLRLEIKKYHFLENKLGDKKYYGMIAQEVESVFPEVVKHATGDDGKDFYTMDYSSFGVLAIKAIQEQQQKINSQDKKIEELTKLITQIIQGSAVSNSVIANDVIVSKDAFLQQNAPNPSSSNTTIRYRIPASVSNAQIMVTNATGAVIKTFTLATKGAGSVTINAGELAAGNYYYTLIVDGKKVDSKQMMIVK
jgi:hypothetical protein